MAANIVINRCQNFYVFFLQAIYLFLTIFNL
jgi:hypothetical protein